MLNEQNENPAYWPVETASSSLFGERSKLVQSCTTGYYQHQFPLPLAEPLSAPPSIRSPILPPGKALKDDSGGEGRTDLKVCFLWQRKTLRKRDSVDEGSHQNNFSDQTSLWDNRKETTLMIIF